MWHAGIFSPGYFSTDDSEDDAVPAGEAGRYALVMLCPSSGSRGGGGGARRDGMRTRDGDGVVRSWVWQPTWREIGA